MTARKIVGSCPVLPSFSPRSAAIINRAISKNIKANTADPGNMDKIMPDVMLGPDGRTCEECIEYYCDEDGGYCSLTGDRETKDSPACQFYDDGRD